MLYDAFPNFKFDSLPYASRLIIPSKSGDSNINLTCRLTLNMSTSQPQILSSASTCWCSSIIRCYTCKKSARKSSLAPVPKGMCDDSEIGQKLELEVKRLSDAQSEGEQKSALQLML